MLSVVGSLGLSENLNYFGIDLVLTLASIYLLHGFTTFSNIYVLVDIYVDSSFIVSSYYTSNCY